jgi:hypothetical protein
MKRQRIGREVDRFGDLSGGHAVGSGLNQEPEHGEAVFLRESGQSRDGICLFHTSTNIEM